MTEKQIIDELIRREGSVYTNRAADKGGPTKYGITLETLREERGGWASAADVANLTENEARGIYRERYIRRPGFDRIPDPRLRELLIDFGVNSGPKRAALALQVAVGGVATDGRIGPETLAKLATLDPARVYASVLRARVKFYVEIALADPEVKRFRASHPRTQLENLRGWINRATEFL